MTDTKELRRLLAEATPGEWKHVELGSNYEEGRGYHYVRVDKSHDLIDTDILAEDAALIVALRNAAPELLDRLERAEQALAQIQRHLDADDENSYRADDGEGAMDRCFALAKKALTAPEETQQ